MVETSSEAGSPDTGTEPPSGERTRLADLSQVFQRGTLVLIGCGAAKRDPEDPTDLRLAVVEPGEPVRGDAGPLGPAWEAQDLYTSSYFAVKRAFAERVGGVADGVDAPPWAILSAKHGVIEPSRPTCPYETRVDDLGVDPTDPEHRVPNRFRRRRPDGQEIVTEMDQWAASVAYGLARWVAGHRDRRDEPWQCRAKTVLVLAGERYVQPLRERGVFEYGIARMAGDPNEGYTLPVSFRYLFEEIDADGIGEQMAWLSDAVSRLDEPAGVTGQTSLGEWSG